MGLYKMVSIRWKKKFDGNRNPPIILSIAMLDTQDTLDYCLGCDSGVDHIGPHLDDNGNYHRCCVFANQN